MKNLILCLILASGITAHCQESPYKYFKLDNKAVKFECIYEAPGKSASELKADLLTFIPSVKGVTDVKENSEGMTAKIDGYQADFRKMGYSQMSAPAFLVYPISGDMSVTVKEGKYRLIISNIMSNKVIQAHKQELFENNEIENVALKLNKSGWATAGNKIDMNKKLESDLYDSFLIKPASNNW